MTSAPISAAGAPGERFWRFSLDLYGRPGVAPACLRLQERLALDVNLLLFCCWAASLGRRLSVDDLRHAVAAVRSWHGDIVRPIRAVRRRLDRGFAESQAGEVEALRQRLLQVEIEAERIEQLRLARLPAVSASDNRAASELAALNLRAYLATLEQRAESPDFADLEFILRASWPAADPILLDATVAS